MRADLDKLKAAVGPDWQAVLRGEGGGSASSVGEQLVRLRDELGKARALNGSLQADFERRQREAKAHHSLTLRVLEGRIAELARRLREAAAKLDTATQRALGNAHAARRALEDGDACADALLAAIARLEARALRAEASEGSAHGATASLEARVASLSAEIDRLRPLEGVAARVDAEAEASRKRFGRARTAAQALSVVYLRQVFLLRRRAREAEARRGALADALAHERGLRRELAVQLEGTVEAANGTRATLLKAVLAAEGKAESERRQLDAVRVQLAEVRRRADGTASELEVAQARERRAEEEQVRLRAKADDALSRLREADGRRQDLLRFFELAFERMLELEGSFGSLMHSDAAGRAAASLASTSLASSHAAALAAKAGAASLAGARAGCAPSASSACAAAPTAAEHGGGGGGGGDGDGGSAHKGGEGGQCGEGASGGAQPAHAADAAAPAPASLHLSPSPAEIQRRFDEQQTVAMAALRALQRSWTIRAALTEQHERFVNAQLPAMGPRSGTAARAARAVHAAGLSGTRPLSASLAPLGDIAHGPAGSPPRGLGSAPAAGVGAGGLGALAGTSAVYGAGRMRSISPPPLPLAQRRALSPEPGGGSALVESQQPKPLSAVLPRVDVSGSCAGGGGGGGGTSHGGGSVWAAASGPMLFGGARPPSSLTLALVSCLLLLLPVALLSLSAFVRELLPACCTVRPCGGGCVPLLRSTSGSPNQSAHAPCAHKAHRSSNPTPPSPTSNSCDRRPRCRRQPERVREPERRQHGQRSARLDSFSANWQRDWRAVDSATWRRRRGQARAACARDAYPGEGPLGPRLGARRAALADGHARDGTDGDGRRPARRAAELAADLQAGRGGAEWRARGCAPLVGQRASRPPGKCGTGPADRRPATCRTGEGQGRSGATIPG